MTETLESLDTLRRRASWRAHHRGTKEMDWLLGKYADAMLPVMDAAALDAFERFMTMPDPDLNQSIIEPAPVNGGEFASLIAAIRKFHRIGETS